MSIYCSIFGFGYEHLPQCKRIHKRSAKVYEQDDSKPCTCGSCPIQYQGSHVLPSLTFNENGNPKEWLTQQKVTDICFEAIKEYFGA